MKEIVDYMHKLLNAGIFCSTSGSGVDKAVAGDLSCAISRAIWLHNWSLRRGPCFTANKTHQSECSVCILSKNVLLEYY